MPNSARNPSLNGIPRGVRLGSWLRENSEIEFANGNFVSTSINLKNKSAGDGCRDKTIEKTILRAFRARTFSRSLGQNRKSSMRAHVFRFAPESRHSACPFRASISRLRRDSVAISIRAGLSAHIGVGKGGRSFKVAQ